MFHLGNVLEFIVYGFYDSPLSQQNPVRDFHDCAFHVASEFCYKLYPVHEQPLEKMLADVSLVPDEFPVYEIHKILVFQWLAVINITGSYHEVQQLALLIANQVQLEAEEPSHGTLASLGYALEGLMNVNPQVPAYSQGSAVHETDAYAFSKQRLFDEQRQRESHLFLKFHETAVRDNPREEMAKVLADLLQIEMLQTAIARIMKQYHD